MTDVIAGRVDDIPPGTRTIVEHEGRSIGVFNVDGEFFALRNSCPHQGGPLCLGQVSGFRTSDGPGRYRYTRVGEVVRCPWHAWEFDMRTGQSWFDPKRTRVKPYEVKVRSGAELAVADTDGLVPGPYQAETYAVRVEDSYVVVTV